jgi:hypothetical protein
LLQEAADADVAVVLLDVVLGYGSHPDPASELAPTVLEARNMARSTGRELACVISLCGTDADPQSMSRQHEELTTAGTLVVQSNALASRIALALSRGDLSGLPRR